MVSRVYVLCACLLSLAPALTFSTHDQPEKNGAFSNKNVWIQQANNDIVLSNSLNLRHPRSLAGNQSADKSQKQKRSPPSIPGCYGEGEEGINDACQVGDWRVCGRSGNDTRSGASAGVKDWPWMAAIINAKNYTQFCGGTLITRRHVLSAAHCFYGKLKASDVLVYLGDYTLSTSDDSKMKPFTVREIINHEDFDHNNLENDIAILVLSKTSKYNSYIQPCCLPVSGPKYLNLSAIVAGWGSTTGGDIHKPSDTLREVGVPVWLNEQCQHNYSQKIFTTNVCAAAFEGGKDACRGDSGGPLVIQRSDGRWMVVGVVSWGIECGAIHQPGIYTRVNEYIEWISDIIN